MRTTTFGGTIIESVDDDLGLVDAMMTYVADEVYATVRLDPDSYKYDFEVMENVDGEILASSDPIFDSRDAVRRYLTSHVSEIQFI